MKYSRLPMLWWFWVESEGTKARGNDSPGVEPLGGVSTEATIREETHTSRQTPWLLTAGGTCLAVQWWGSHLPTQDSQARSLQGDSPDRWSHKARGPQLLTLGSRARGSQRLTPRAAVTEARVPWGGLQPEIRGSPVESRTWIKPKEWNSPRSSQLQKSHTATKI